LDFLALLAEEVWFGGEMVLLDGTLYFFGALFRLVSLAALVA
jgi:hypothetical protein